MEDFECLPLHSSKPHQGNHLCVFNLFTVFTASTEHDSKTTNTITYTCFNRIIEFDF